MPTDPSPLPSLAEVIDALAPIRIPAEFAAFDWRDGLIAFSLGLLGAAVLSLLLRPFFHRAQDPLARMRDALAALSEKPFQDRLLGQAMFMNDLKADPPLDPSYRDALYRPVKGDELDLDELDRRILAAVAARRPAKAKAKGKDKATSGGKR